MIPGVATLVYLACNLMAIGTGIALLSGLFHGLLPKKFAINFLRFALAAGTVGLLFPFPHLLLTGKEEISMLTVYLAGIVILAWHRFQLAGPWSSIFVLSASLILYLNLLGFTAEAFTQTSLAAAAPQFKSLLLLAQAVLLLLFVALGMIASKRFRNYTQGFEHRISAGMRSS